VIAQFTATLAQEMSDVLADMQDLVHRHNVDLDVLNRHTNFNTNEAFFLAVMDKVKTTEYRQCKDGLYDIDKPCIANCCACKTGMCPRIKEGSMRAANDDTLRELLAKLRNEGWFQRHPLRAFRVAHDGTIAADRNLLVRMRKGYNQKDGSIWALSEGTTYVEDKVCCEVSAGVYLEKGHTIGGGPLVERFCADETNFNDAFQKGKTLYDSTMLHSAHHIGPFLLAHNGVQKVGDLYTHTNTFIQRHMHTYFLKRTKAHAYKFLKRTWVHTCMYTHMRHSYVHAYIHPYMATSVHGKHMHTKAHAHKRH
jgi:hypothetical protein